MPQCNRENRQLRNEAPLNFVALRSLAHGVGSGALSRVFDERPAGALDSASEPLRGTCVLDEADDFIDVDNSIPINDDFAPSTVQAALLVVKAISCQLTRMAETGTALESPPVSRTLESADRREGACYGREA